MPTVSGNLKKMKVEGTQPVEYTLDLNGTVIEMNELLGQFIQMEFKGVIHCKNCGEVTEKSFMQGFCFKCFNDSPSNAPCIIHPELCEGHLGKGRDPEWELRHHVQPHVVYLAVTSGVKVGVTRQTQVPTRWIDQGAWKTIQLAETPNRFLAGQIEVALKEHLSDKTFWQRMLKNELDYSVDLIKEKERVHDLLPKELQAYLSPDSEVLEIEYPVDQYPESVKSLNFDKTPLIEETLVGIKGQYLLFENETVINIRKFTGYLVDFTFED